MKKELESNVKKLRWFSIFRHFILIAPIFVLFQLENGLNLTQVMILGSIISITGLVMEVPSGIFADLYGRKNSLTLGAVLFLVGGLIRAASTNFLSFAIAVSSVAVGLSFISGANTAFLYDSLVCIKKEKQFKKINGSMWSAALISTAVASLIGGSLSFLGLRTVHYLMVIPAILMILISILMKEPPLHKKVIEKRYFQHLKESLIFSITHKRVRGVIFYYGFMMGFIVVILVLVQPYMKLIGIETIHFGVYYFVFLLIGAFAAKYAYAIEGKIGERNFIILLPLLLVLQLLLMGKYAIYLGFLFIFLGEFVWGSIKPVIDHYAHKHISSHRRATVMSIKAMSAKVIWAIFSPLIGFFADLYSLQTALLISGGIVLVFTVIIFIFWDPENSRCQTT